MLTLTLTLALTLLTLTLLTLTLLTLLTLIKYHSEFDHLNCIFPQKFTNLNPNANLNPGILTLNLTLLSSG